MNYYILFDVTSSDEFKFGVLRDIIDYYNQRVGSFAVIAELNKAVVRVDEELKTATFTAGTLREARVNLKDYRDNEKGLFRIIQRRIKKEI